MIGYYIHHHGTGHLNRATAIARHLGDVTGLSSRPRPASWDGPWVTLPRDDAPPIGGEADPTAHGALHWAPLAHPGLRERMAELASWVRAAAPRLMVVDVSVEVAVLIRAMGVPVVVMGIPGERADPAHQLAYRIAQAIIAPWPAWSGLLGGGSAWRPKTHEVGAISRFDGRARLRARTPAGDRRRRVLLLSGLGGTELTADMLAATRHATPDSVWTNLGPPGDRWIADPWALICGADVVVTHAGQNAIADVAAAGRPAVVVPQARPHHEQRAMATALHRAGLATVCERWPAPHDWPSTLAMAAARGSAGWSRWTSGTGGRRAADVLMTLLHQGQNEERQCA